MGMSWQRLLGSAAIAMVFIAVVFGRHIVSGLIDLPALILGFVLSALVAYLAWPGLAYVRLRR
jgi:hypothetical protein